MKKGDRVYDETWSALGLGTVHKIGSEYSLVKWDNYREHGCPQYDYVLNRYLRQDDRL